MKSRKPQGMPHPAQDSKFLSMGPCVIPYPAAAIGVLGLVGKVPLEAVASSPAEEYMNKVAALKDIFLAWIFLLMFC